MDDDHYEYDEVEYSAKISGCLVMRILANDFDEAYAILDGMFKDGTIDVDCYSDTEYIVRKGTVPDEDGRHTYSTMTMDGYRHFKYVYEVKMDVYCYEKCSYSNARDIMDELEEILEERCTPDGIPEAECYSFKDADVEEVDAC